MGQPPFKGAEPVVPAGGGGLSDQAGSPAGRIGTEQSQVAGEDRDGVRPDVYPRRRSVDFGGRNSRTRTTLALASMCSIVRTRFQRAGTSRVARPAKLMGDDTWHQVMRGWSRAAGSAQHS